MKEKDMCEMIDEGKRLKTFKKWPFRDDTKINKEKMAAAGFFFIGTKKFPDLVKCYVCLKELDGWEEDDDPWEEHKSHASYCQFIQKYKPDMTFQEMHELEMHRLQNLSE